VSAVAGKPLSPRRPAARLAPHAATRRRLVRLGCGVALGLLLSGYSAPAPAFAAPSDEAGGEQDMSGSITRSVPLGPDFAALLSLPRATPARASLPAVILLSDGPGKDRRSELYMMRLLALGLAVLDADFESTRTGEWGGTEPVAPAVGQRLGLAIAALRGAEEIDPARIAVIGLGEGARAVLLAPGDAMPQGGAVLLYPGCDAILAEAARRLAAVPLLLLHGDDDPTNAMEACAALAAAGGMDRAVLPGASYGWDVTAFRSTRLTIMPDPRDPLRRVAGRSEPMLAQIALDWVLSFLLPRLQPTEGIN